MNYISQPDLTPADLLRGDIQLATPPAIYFALKKVINDPTKSLLDTAAVIEKDPGLSARLLKIVNSAFYGFPAQITSIERAINMIGNLELQNLVLGTVIIERFSDLPGALSMSEFWANSLKCALITAEIDHYKGGQFSESAFICGLLHDIGKLIFYRKIPELAREVDLLLRNEQHAYAATEITLEEEIIGINHFETGAELCRLWNLPEIISATIEQQSTADISSQYRQIATIVQISRDYSTLEIDFAEDKITELDLTQNEILELVDQAYDKFEEIFKIFYPEK